MSKCEPAPPIYGHLEPEYLLHYAAMNESNVVITGLPGTGKTTLVKTALRNLPEGFSAIVFDTARDFGEDVCDEYGVFSVDTTKVDPLIAVDLIEEALETVYRTYSLVWTPAMAELTIRALQAKVPLAKLAEKVEEFADVHELSTSISVIRRARYFQYPHFDDSAPRLEPKPGVVTCVDLNDMNPITRSAYVLFTLHTLKDRKNIFYIIDEAHRFMRTSRALITEYMRVGRHNMQLFVLITQSINDIKEREGYAKIFVQFPAYGEEAVGPQWATTQRALVTMYVTNPRAEKALPPHHGVLRRYVLTVSPGALKST